MSAFKVVYKASTKNVKVIPSATAIPSGYTDAGTFNHIADAADKHGADVNHTIIHHINSRLYSIGVLTTQNLTIDVPVDSMTLTPNKTTLDISDGDRGYLAIAFNPPFAPKQAVTYSSSDTSKATVDANGKVTPVGAGSVTITVTNTDSGKTATQVFTIQA